MGLLAVVVALSGSACAASETVGASPDAVNATASPSTGVTLSQNGVVYYVRADGGSADQCSGLVDAAYTGASRDCAWNHPFQALPPGGPPRMAGGDTLIIASGSYMMGYGAPGAQDCEASYPWECSMCAIPSGPDAEHPTRILGEGWDGGCEDPPELWGTERAYQILDLSDSDNVEIACLEITDHSGCVESHSGTLACERETYPFGQWAATGLYAQESENVRLAHLNIHGLASAGVRAGRLTDRTVEDVRIAGNGWVGWDGDLWEGSDTNAGTLTFRRWTVEWNGCGETYPGEEPAGCWGQEAGGYGDGVGTGATGGDWIIEDSSFLHNTSDGLDLLYHTLGGTIHLNRVRAEGNAGNPVKIAGTALITNSVLVGNCAFFEGQPFTYWVDHCRALGNTLSLSYQGGTSVSLINSTLYGQGDGLICAGPALSGACDGSEMLVGRNNILLGDADYGDPSDVSFVYYQEGCPDLVFDSDYSLVYGAKMSLYVPGSHDLWSDPLLVGPLSGDAYDLTLASDSPAIDAGTPHGAPAVDFGGAPRDAAPDMGAYEYGAGDVWQVSLAQGWNLVSLPIVPTDAAPANVLAAIDGRYSHEIRFQSDTDQWVSYIPGEPLASDLDIIDESTAFWILMLEPATLSVSGTLPSTTVQELVIGWNMVAYPATQPRAVSQALSSIAGSYSTVFGHDAFASDPWQVYQVASPSWANSLDVLSPGSGYWIKATADCTLTISR